MTQESKRPAETPTEGPERRRFQRLARRLSVTFTLEGQEVVAQTVDVSKTGALFAARYAPTMGTRLLLNLSDRQNPDLSLYLKATVVRLEEGEGKEVRFGVEFGDAIARDPKRLRMFLAKALGIDTGLIRVVSGEEGEQRAYAFSFESIHREGTERLKALQSSLFQNFDEMEEADELLANFGRTPVASDIETAKAPEMTRKVDTEPTAPPPPQKSAEETKAAKKAAKAAKKAAKAAQKAAKAAQKAPQQAKQPPQKAEEAEAAPVPGLTDADAKAMLSVDRPATAELPPQSSRPSFFKRLLAGSDKKKNANKGETLIQTQRLATIVANDVNLPVVYRVGTTRYQATATRLYCAGLKCRTTQSLPQLYAAISIIIPLAGARRISQIELTGDVTRVRADDENSEAGGIFEVRLSMRTDKTHLELYRVLLERLIGKTMP